MADTTTADEPTYTVDELVEYAFLRLGESPHAVRGALGRQQKKHFTIAEARRLVSDFKARKVS